MRSASTLLRCGCAAAASSQAKAASSGAFRAGALLGLDTVASFGRRSGLSHTLGRAVGSRAVFSARDKPPTWRRHQ
jgi:hypothetical protein